VLSLALGGQDEWSGLLPVWTTWWLGDLAGAVVVTPVVVLWAIDRPRLARAGGRSETLLVIVLAALIGLPAFAPAHRPAGSPALAFLSIVPLLWSSLRGRERDTATAAV